MSDEQPTAPPSVIVVAGQRFTVTAEPASVGAPGQKPGPLAEPGTPPAPAAETAPPAEAAPPAETPPAAPPRHAAPEHAVSETGPPHLDPPMAVTGQYLPALDGVRALAIVGSLPTTWASGGPRAATSGVDLFFVLSGFLITACCSRSGATPPHRPGGVLGAPGPAPAARPVPRCWSPCRSTPCSTGVSAPPGGGAAVDLSGLRGDGLATLFYVANWHCDLRAPVVLRPVLGAVTAHPHLVAGHRGAVLLGVAPAVVACSAGPRRRGLAPGRHGAAVRRPGARPAPWPLLYHPGGGPHPGLLRHRHPGLRPAGRRGAGLWWPPARPARARRARRCTLAVPAAAAALGVLWVTAGPGGLPPGYVPGGFLLCRPGRGGHRRRPPGRPGPLARCCPSPAALDRHHLLWDLPVALAAVRLPDGPDRTVGSRSTCPGGRHSGHRRRQLLPGRAPVRRSRSGQAVALARPPPRPPPRHSLSATSPRSRRRPAPSQSAR